MVSHKIEYYQCGGIYCYKQICLMDFYSKLCFVSFGVCAFWLFLLLITCFFGLCLAINLCVLFGCSCM